MNLWSRNLYSIITAIDLTLNLPECTTKPGREETQRSAEIYNAKHIIFMQPELVIAAVCAPLVEMPHISWPQGPSTNLGVSSL